MTDSLPYSLLPKPTRRNFLADMGMGFTGLALGSMLSGEGIVRGESPAAGMLPEGMAHFAPQAKSVIWIFLVGGMSQMESFDPKPELNAWAGKTYDESPYKSVVDSPYLKKNLRELVEGLHKVQKVRSEWFGIFRLVVASRPARRRHRSGAVDVDDR